MSTVEPGMDPPRSNKPGFRYPPAVAEDPQRAEKMAYALKTSGFPNLDRLFKETFSKLIWPDAFCRQQQSLMQQISDYLREVSQVQLKVAQEFRAGPFPHLDLLSQQLKAILANFQPPKFTFYLPKFALASDPFWDLIRRVNGGDFEALDVLLARYFPPQRVFGRKWYEMRSHCSQSFDPATGTPLTPEATYYHIAKTAVFMAFQVNDLEDINPGAHLGFAGPLQESPVTELHNILSRIVRRVVRQDIYGVWGEGEYRLKHRLWLDHADETIYGRDVKVPMGPIDRIFIPSSNIGSPDHSGLLDTPPRLPEIIAMDELTPAERRAVERVLDGLQEGYDFDSKRDLSLRQFLGKDYNSVMKSFSRARCKLRRD